MKVSVIIPTYNGQGKIANLLQSLEKQTIEWFETIIIIDGSTDGTEAFLRQENWSFPIFITNQANSGRSTVRNVGAKNAAGELLIFFDDDMRLAPNCIAAHVNHHLTNERTIFTGAQIDDLSLAKGDFQIYKCWLSKQWSASLKSFEGQPLPFSNLHLTAANMSISKSLFNELGGFDANLRDCEDYDFAVRAYHAGIPIYYSESAFGCHDDFPSATSFIKRQLEYFHFNKFLYSKYPKRFAHFEASRLKKPGHFKRKFFRLFQSVWWPDAIDRNKFIFLPKRIRYKLYSWIVTAHSTYKS